VVLLEALPGSPEYGTWLDHPELARSAELLAGRPEYRTTVERVVNGYRVRLWLRGGTEGNARLPANKSESPDHCPLMRPVSIVTVTFDSIFFTRLLVEKVREFAGPREYEIIAVDRGSRDGSREWLAVQPDVRLLTLRQGRSGHGHGEAAEAGARRARHETVVLLDSDAHPIGPGWLAETADRLDEHVRLAGAVFRDAHPGNQQGWYIHPHFMAFRRSDLGRHVILRKRRGHDLDTGEEATLRVLDAGLGIIGHPLAQRARFSVCHPLFPSDAPDVFHAWYGTRLARKPDSVVRETNGEVTPESYLEPLKERLRQAYGLAY
jgi:hypothetical protein